ncbi:LpqB family beta-propeller domain-containing protein [Couchioplanes caeruleus]|uniref:LpqB family beta-propeller domain-containing protein n=1 Tax=Couchioplanes caeruleus TaxID=56438 RepID=UPI0020BEADE0|nr:LpqB family beta-propeller domain-containing protein [Couchioplanes caeruleus]UQU63912.1 LpqB family beta-propeller domain-containing protein [Couchioplanes caeruleus]
MRKLARTLLAGALTGTLLLGGCGIPDNTDVVTVGPGPSTGFSSNDDGAPPRYGREATLDTAKFVEYYLQAAGGDPDGAVDRVKQFLSPAAAASFKPPEGVKIVYLTEDPLVNPGSDQVELRVRTLGVLGPNGRLDPVQDTGITTYQLSVASISGKTGLFVTKAPPVLLLSDTAFTTWFVRRTIYFWNHEYTALVPDVRYLPADMPPEQEPQRIIKWLIEGPSDTIHDAVEPLPEGTALLGNVPAVSNDKLQISLSAQSVRPPDDPKALDRLRRQLMWSLRPNLSRVLELKIGNQEQTSYDGNDYLTSNPTYRLADSPERFLIYNNQIRRMSRTPGAADPLPVIKPEANRNVRAAAFARSPSDRRYAALITTEGNHQVLRVGSAGIGELSDLRRVTLRGGSTGQPVWAITSDDPQTGAVGLLTIGGKLFSFSADGSPLRAVAWPGPPGMITAVAVAPDGRRVALAVGGKLYLAALTADGDGPQLSPPRQVQLPVLREVSAVDWGTETSVIVAGTRADRDRVAVIDTAIDGTQWIESLADIGVEKVTYLATYPVSPSSGKVTPDVIEYMANGATFDVLSGPVRIGVGDLAEPVTNAPAGVVPTAPSFLR